MTAATLAIPVSLRHPGRLTSWSSHRRGYFRIGRHLVTAVSCTCANGAAGCQHAADVRTLTAQIATTPEPLRSQAEMQQQDRHTTPTLPAAELLTAAELDTAGVDPAAPITPEIAANVRANVAATIAAPGALLTVDQAAAKLGVTPAWTRRLLRNRRLTAHDGQVLAASVDSYAAQRQAARDATRFHRAEPTTDAEHIAAAKAAQRRACKLEKEAAQLRKLANATYERYGVGAHDGWVITRGEPSEVNAFTRSGSWHATPAA